MTLPALQFPLYGFPNEIGAVLFFAEHGVNPVKGAFSEPGLHIFGPHFFSSHVDFSHMRY